MLILLTGATGYIGGRLIARLLAQGHRLRVLARDPRKLSLPPDGQVEVVHGDVLDPASLVPALTGAEVAYYLVHSMTTGSDDFAARDRAAARNFTAACAAAGVGRIIYLGALGGSNAGLSRHLASRHEVGRILREGPVPVTELRAAIIVGAGSASFEIIRDLVRRLPVMVCPRWVRSRCEPIAVSQVLDYLLGVLDEPRTIGQVLEIGGGEILTYEAMIRGCAAALGRRVLIVTVPVLTPRLSSYWLNLVTSVPMSLARPLIEGLRNDVVTTDHRIREWLPVRDVPYREAVAAALAEDATGAPASRWTHASTAPPSGPLAGPVLRDVRERHSTASPAALFAAVERVGGFTGWYFADWLWRLRGRLDRLVGGVGMRRGRSHPTRAAVGDPIDFWRVEEVVPQRLLRLRAEMRLPGEATLEFAVTPPAAGAGATLRQLALFRPRGVWGRLYWYALWPLHTWVFAGMASAIARAAESAPSRASG